MTFLVPNYFLEEQPQNVISSDGLFSVTYSSKRDTNAILVRNLTHVMILLTNGTKRLQFDDTTCLLEKGSLFFLAQGNYVMSEVLDKNGLYEAVMVYFDDSYVLDFIKTHQIDLSFSPKSKVVTFKADALLDDVMHSFSGYLTAELAHKPSIVKLKTEEISLHLLSTEKEKFYPFLQHIVASSQGRICYLLEENLDIIQSVDDMARIARVSKQELRKKLFECAGLSPKTWLDTKRMQQAATLLKHSDQSITSIATSCGYSTASWFGAQFKKHYGVTPKEYREQNR